LPDYAAAGCLIHATLPPRRQPDAIVNAPSTIAQPAQQGLRRLPRPGGAVPLLVLAILRHDARSLMFGLVACAVAATVASFQFAVFTSFLAAGAAVPRFIAADAWIAAAGVECFDFPAPFSQAYAGAVQAHLPGARIRPVLMGFAGSAGPAASAGNVVLIGMEGTGLAERQFMADRSDRRRLRLDAGTPALQVGGVLLFERAQTAALATFLGAPYVVVPVETARRALGWPATTVAFLTVDFPGGVPADLEQRLAALARHYPELAGFTGRQFEASSSQYWQAKTGAGAAILLAALLAALLMLLLLVNAVARFVQRRQADILSLIGHGASESDVLLLLMSMAGVLVIGSLLAVVLAAPLITLAADPWLPWVAFKPVDALFAVLLGALAFAVATLAARADLKRFPADAIFRS
jgi:hypothetical protein